MTAARCRAYVADHGLLLGRLRSGSPALCPLGALFGAADSAFRLRRVRDPTLGSICRTRGRLRSLGRRVGSFGRISVCPATAATPLTHHGTRGFELKMSVWRSPVRAVVDGPELPFARSRYYGVGALLPMPGWSKRATVFDHEPSRDPIDFLLSCSRVRKRDLDRPRMKLDVSMLVADVAGARVESLPG